MRIFLSVLFLCITCTLFAQGGAPVPMADEMRSNGKIYVVLAVILTIFAGIIVYLVRLDRKLTQLEKENRSHQ